jgi:DNA-binding NarL/FixJ family response regulator
MARVLVAEDEVLIRVDIVETLEESGHTVVGEAGDGEQALRLARELGPDLVVMDVKMPKVDGLTAARQITAEGPAVLILTAFSDKELVEEAADAGTIGYLVKPFQPAQLLAGVSRPQGDREGQGTAHGAVRPHRGPGLHPDAPGGDGPPAPAVRDRQAGP